MLRNPLYGLVLAGSIFGASGTAFAQTAALNDGQILQYVQTVNESEISDARLALMRAKSAEVKAFAQHMLDDHSKSEKAIAALVGKAKIKLANSEVTATLKNAAEAGYKELKAVEGAGFDKQYARAQAKMHGEVATTLQSQLMPMAQSDAVKSILSEALSTVQEHQRSAHDLTSRVGT
jgi:putative membrane protein